MAAQIFFLIFNAFIEVLWHRPTIINSLHNTTIFLLLLLLFSPMKAWNFGDIHHIMKILHNPKYYRCKIFTGANKLSAKNGKFILLAISCYKLFLLLL